MDKKILEIKFKGLPEIEISRIITVIYILLNIGFLVLYKMMGERYAVIPFSFILFHGACLLFITSLTFAVLLYFNPYITRRTVIRSAMFALVISEFISSMGFACPASFIIGLSSKMIVVILGCNVGIFLGKVLIVISKDNSDSNLHTFTGNTNN